MSSKTPSLFVHDRIFHYGGAGMVLSQLISKYGQIDSKVFVLFSPYEQYDNLEVVTALPRWLNNKIATAQSSGWFLTRRLFDYRNLMPFYGMLVILLRRKIRRHETDHLIVSSFAAVKNIARGSLLHTPYKKTLYVHSPMQYIRENYDEYCKKLRGIKKIIFQAVSGTLRKWDKRTVQYDTIFVNSAYTERCVQSLYGWNETTVLYPALPNAYITTSAIAPVHDYYIYIGRLVNFVRETDTIIRLCNDLSVPLLVVGSGPDEDYLKSIAGPTITFLGLITDDVKKISLLTQSKGLINIAKESLGIVTMEALSLGVPVLGYDDGGTQELIRSTSRGVKVTTKDQATLEKGVQTFVTTSYDRQAIKNEFLTYYDSVGSII